MTSMHQSCKIIRDQAEPASLSKLIYCGKSLSLKLDFMWAKRNSCHKCIIACMTAQLDEYNFEMYTEETRKLNQQLIKEF